MTRNSGDHSRSSSPDILTADFGISQKKSTPSPKRTTSARIGNMSLSESANIELAPTSEMEGIEMESESVIDSEKKLPPPQPSSSPLTSSPPQTSVASQPSSSPLTSSPAQISVASQPSSLPQSPSASQPSSSSQPPPSPRISSAHHPSATPQPSAPQPVTLSQASLSLHKSPGKIQAPAQLKTTRNKSDPLVFDLSSSKWNNSALEKIKKPGLKLTPNFKKDFSDFNKDPITARAFAANIISVDKNKVEQGKKRALTSTPTTEYSYPKSIRISTPQNTKEPLSKSQLAVLKSRDILVEAYSMTEDRDEQTNLLALLEVFRYYTEYGRVQNIKPRESSSAKANPSLSTPNKSLSASTVTQPLWTTVVKKSIPKQSATNATTRINADESIQGKTLEPTRSEKVLTIVLTKDGAAMPKYNPTTVRNTINTALGKVAISRVHTSPNKNIVLTCHDSSPDELLIKKSDWVSVTSEWSVDDIRKVGDHAKLVVHGVPTSMTISDFKEEVSTFNPGVQLEGEPRWLTTTSNKFHSSMVVSVTNETEKAKIRRSGLLVGGILLKVVNFQSSTVKSQCRKCLKYGHQATLCSKPAKCAYCAGEHLTTNHICSTCKSSQQCAHVQKKCANCNSTSHSAFEREHCEVFKALS